MRTPSSHRSTRSRRALPVAQHTAAANRAKLAKEALCLALVWLALVVGFLLAGYGDGTTGKSQRYALELASATAGVTKPQLLTAACGEDVMTRLAQTMAQGTDPNNTLAQVCPNLQETAARQASIAQAREQLDNVQTALAQAWQSVRRDQRQTDLVRNETGVVLGADRLHSRQDWLNLNADGQLDSVATLLTTKQNPSDNLAQTLAWLAVADGNRRFAYSKLFADDPAAAARYNQAASDVARVYDTNTNQTKAAQALSLLPLFGKVTALGLLAQVCIWSWVSWGLLLLAQRVHPVLAIGQALVAWGVVIAAISHGVIAPFRVGIVLFCIGVAWCAASVFAPVERRLARLPDNRELKTSAWLYPLFVGFTSFGLLIVFDLSTRSYLSLRYLFLNHFKDLFWCFVMVSLARPLASVVAWAMQNLAARNWLHGLWDTRIGERRKAWLWLGAALVGFLGLVVLLRGDSAKVAELAKAWLLVFSAVFLAINQRGLIGQILPRRSKMTALLVWALLPPVAALLLANEKGTLLVIGFVLTFLLGVALSNLIFQRGGRGYVLGVLSSTAILLLLLTALVNVSGFDARTAERVNAWINPFIASNDQMAILHWFRESVPPLGYGLGHIPWCGYRLSGCQGVPLQMQSDYTITSVMAVVGVTPAIALMVVYFAWLWLMARQQLAYGNEQIKTQLQHGGYFWLAWLILLWVVVTVFQALVTISGNLGLLPLTGVTLPFISYGTSNLWFNTVLFSLTLFSPKLILANLAPHATNKASR